MKKVSLIQMESTFAGGGLGCGTAVALSAAAAFGVVVTVATGGGALLVASAFLGMVSADMAIFDKCQN